MKKCFFVLSLIMTMALNAQTEFNWVPSGFIDVAKPQSVAQANYQSHKNNLLSELTQAESFVIQPASCRGGAAQEDVVIVKTIKRSQTPISAKIFVANTQVGTWDIAPPVGNSELYDAIYLLPYSVWSKGQGRNSQIPIRLEFSKGHTALQYRFYVTRDWHVLGDSLSGSLDQAVKIAGEKSTYLKGLQAGATRDWSQAAQLFEKVASSTDKEYARLGRWALRRALLKNAVAKLPKQAQSFDVHYKLGLYAGACGIWEEALTEFQKALEINPIDADATYRLAEAMEYNRMNVAEFAPVFERAGLLGKDQSCNQNDIMIAVYLNSIYNFCTSFSADDLVELKKNWGYVEQMVLGASFGKYCFNTDYKFFDNNDAPFVMQAGWIFLPSDVTVPIPGSYDYTIGTAGYGSSHAGGVDCGVNFSGGAQVGPQRGWEVWLHEWNHQFDWTFLFGEQGPGYPVTHDSDGCGKQPIVSMGCGHRSSMRYYINKAQYSRHEPSDPLVADTMISPWSVGEVINLPQPPATDINTLTNWLVAQNIMTTQQLLDYHRNWIIDKNNDLSVDSKDPKINSEPPRKPFPTFNQFLLNAWLGMLIIDDVAPQEDFVLGRNSSTNLKTINGQNDFNDLLAAFPEASHKAVAYARSYLFSPVDQEVRIWVGYNDNANFWINGRKICSGVYYACAKWQDQNYPHEFVLYASLKKGWNVVAAKIARGGGDWGFSAHVTDFSNKKIEGLKFADKISDKIKVARYQAPKSGELYQWNTVKDDYLELLPHLSANDLAKFTGVTGLTLNSEVFMIGLPENSDPVNGSNYINAPNQDDIQFNNFLNWDKEAAAAFRYVKDGKNFDLLMIRPEYYDEFLQLTKTTQNSANLDKSIVGCIYLDKCNYKSVPSGRARSVIVVRCELGDYPEDDLDILAIPACSK